jgi:flagellar biosynthesis anti-sigma factor FlgM
MRINDPSLSGINVGALKTTSAEKVTAPSGSVAEQGGAGGGDAVQLSALAKSLDALQSDSASRKTRVEELAKAVESGAYQPDSGAVAESLVRDALTQDGLESGSNQ